MWEKFYELVHSEKYSIPYPMLDYLIRHGFCEIPESVLTLLSSKTMNRNLTRQVQYALTPHTNDDFIGMRRLFLKIHFINKGNVFKDVKTGIDHYLYAWNLKGLSDLIPAVLRKFKQKIRR